MPLFTDRNRAALIAVNGGLNGRERASESARPAAERPRHLIDWLNHLHAFGADTRERSAGSRMGSRFLGKLRGRLDAGCNRVPDSATRSVDEFADDIRAVRSSWLRSQINRDRRGSGQFWPLMPKLRSAAAIRHWKRNSRLRLDELQRFGRQPSTPRSRWPWRRATTGLLRHQLQATSFRPPNIQRRTVQSPG